MPVDQTLRIATHDALGASHFLLSLRREDGGGALREWAPGQFAMITLGGVPDGTDPLLRRPFSIFNDAHDADGTLAIFYKILGRGTALLSRARVGDTLRCLAPLGNGFAPDLGGGRRLLLVAGGIGSASLHPLALAARREGGRPVMLYGCRTAAETAGVRPTRDAGIEVHVATDDGTEGFHGYASALLDDFLGREDPAHWSVCACGPMPMMKATAAVARRRGVVCHVSLESPMACGFGVCVGCVVPVLPADPAPPVLEAPGTGVRYARICIEGPVFDAARVVW